MTKREREQVVELLRCAADHDPFAPHWEDEKCVGLTSAEFALYGQAMDIWHSARNAAMASGLDEYNMRAAFLEAAARIEEGSYP